MMFSDMKLMVHQTIATLLTLPILSLAQPPIQCSPSWNGTIGDGTAGSEQQINATTVNIFNATDADQGVAVDADYVYSIDNFSITKRNKTTGDALLQWYGGEDGAIIHLDGGVVINGTLYAPHSNYHAVPETSSIEMWNVTTMEHIGSHSFGVYRGSMTWLDQHNGVWYGTFANYDRVQEGQTQPYGLTMNTQLVEMTPDFRITRSWIFPEELWTNYFTPMSNSGGSFGPDGWLYVTGHDEDAAFVVRLPSAGSILEWVATVHMPDIAGQGIAWDRSVPRDQEPSIWGISRENHQLIEMKVPLQQCGWESKLVVGQVLGPGQFIDPSGD